MSESPHDGTRVREARADAHKSVCRVLTRHKKFDTAQLFELEFHTSAIRFARTPRFFITLLRQLAEFSTREH